MKYLDKLSESFYIVFVLCFLVATIAIYFMHQNSLMAQNMTSAIEKGIDPLSVRCSYAGSSDLLCVAFAASAQSHNVANKK